VVEAITAGRDDYNQKLFFHAPLDNLEAIRYRQDVLRDCLNNPSIARAIAEVYAKMTTPKNLCAAWLQPGTR
jgi:hypothetical protein